MKTPSYACSYVVAILFFLLSGFPAFSARAQSFPERYASCIQKHPTWSVDDCDRIARGRRWKGMSDAQREAARESQSEMPPAPVVERSAATSPAKTAQPRSVDAASAGLWIVVLLFLGAGVYLLPAIVGSARHHHQSASIWMLNIFLGWTFVGWVGALVWAVSASPGSPRAAS